MADEKEKKYRPQNKNLRLFNEIPVEEARAIQSAGGKASHEARKKRQAMADLLLLYSGLPIKDARIRKRLKNLGVPCTLIRSENLVQLRARTRKTTCSR